MLSNEGLALHDQRQEGEWAAQDFWSSWAELAAVCTLGLGVQAAAEHKHW